MPQEGSPLGSPLDAARTGKAVQSMFSRVAPRYDFLNHFLSLGLDVLWRRSVARQFRSILSQPESTTVDVCCGTGDLVLSFARLAKGRLLGVDFCHPMLQLAGKKAFARAVHFVGADAMCLPIADNSIDLISSAFGFRNLANYVSGLAEMYRVLKPGGSIAILEFSSVRWPIFGPIFRFYFAHILPRLGDWLSGVSGPYEYLHKSVMGFPDQDSLAALMRAAGYVNVTYRNFIGGVAALHAGQKAGPVPA